MRRPTKIAQWCILLAALFGLWQIGQGLYIYAKAQLAQWLITQAWQNSLRDQTPIKPWAWADTWPVARINVPRLGIDWVVLAGDSGRTLAFGPGHRFGTALPGQPGTSVISGHRDTHFQFLRELKPGDKISVQMQNGHQQIYQIQRAFITHENRLRLATNDKAQPSLALVTCYPFDALRAGGPLRYVAVAEALNREENS